MRIRTVVATAVLAVVALVPLTGAASALPADGDRDCRDFASQAAAQSALDSQWGDPERLDGDGDGIACEEIFIVPRSTELATTPTVAPPAEDELVVAPSSTPAATSVQTVPEHQILVRPQGAPDTGDGSAAPHGSAPLLLLAGGLAVTIGAGYGAIRRRSVGRSR